MERGLTAQLDLAFTPGLVSIIVPCFNMERFLDRFLQSLYAQSYKQLEIIFVNDGSSDGTGAMLQAAVPRLEAQGYQVKLIQQPNKGLGGAIDSGLKHFTGEFLMWPDPDDWLTEDSIERRVVLMTAHPKIAVLRSNAHCFLDKRGELDGYLMPADAPSCQPQDLLDDLIFQRAFDAPICYLVRSEAFVAVHPTRSIYFRPHSSQNFQLLVPLVESHPVLQVHEPLAFYCVREDSRSHAVRDPVKLMTRFDQLLDIAEHTLPRLRTYRPEALTCVRNYHWRRRILPSSFRAAMKERTRDLIDRSALSGFRKAAGRALLSIRCNRLFRALDEATGRVLSRAMARMFDRIVAMPAGEMRWRAVSGEG